MSTLLKYTLRIADNSLILGQRMAEWCSKGPTLEEDIAMSNIALDLFGQANGFLEYASKIDGQKTADDLAFKRDASNFFNFCLVEVENGHFGNTMIRSLLFDTFYLLFYKELSRSKDENLAALAFKSLKEIKYHFRHSQNWVIRLGDGTKESNKKVQESLNNLWKYTDEFFEIDNVDQIMIDQKIGVNTSLLKKEWTEVIESTINEAKLIKPSTIKMITGGRDGKHSNKLSSLLKDMQYLPRKYPNAKW